MEDLVPRPELGLRCRNAGTRGRGLPATGGGVVGGEFRRDLVVPAQPRRHELQQQEPPQVGIDHQPVPLFGAVQERSNRGQVLRSGRGAGEGSSEGELSIAPGLGTSGQLKRPAGETNKVFLSMGIGRKLVDRHSGLTQHPLNHADVGFGLDTGENELNEITGGHFCVTRHVPGRAPDDCSGEGIGQAANVRSGRGPRILVESNLRKSKVAVVDQEQVRARLADQFRHVGRCSGDIDLNALSKKQSLFGDVVQADSHTV